MQQTFETEIDLRQYVDILMRRWKIVLGAPILLMLAAGLLTVLVLPRRYTATAGVVIVGSRAQITFDPKFKTEEQLGQDPVGRRITLAGLAKSSSLGGDVIAKLGDSLSPEERQIAHLLTQVKVTSQGDLIEIAASASTSETAAAIANAWAEAYVSQVNVLYSLGVQSSSHIQTQAQTAWQTYQEAQQGLEQYLAENRVTILEQQVKTRRTSVTDGYSSLSRLDRIISDAEALHNRLRDGADSQGTSSIPLTLLQMNAFAVASTLGDDKSGGELRQLQQVQLQLSPGSTSNSNESIDRQRQDVEAILRTLQARRKELETRLDGTDLQQELARLQQALENEQARQRELSSRRDLAWETYITLARKEAEVKVASEVTDTEVRLAARALKPEQPAPPKLAQNITLAGLLSIVVAVLTVFVWEYRQGRQNLRPASRIEVKA